MKRSTLQITFLGTGPAVAIPRLGHHDSTCRDAKRKISKTRRLRSSLLIQNDRNAVLIDAGPDFLQQITAAGVRAQNLRAVFLTHEHLDAMGGLYDLNDWLKDADQKITLYCLKETWEKIGDIYTNIKPRFVRVGSALDLDFIKITPFRVRHGIKHNVPTLGFHIAVPIILTTVKIIGTDKINTTRDDKKISENKRITAATTKIIYASDMDGAPPRSKKLFRNAGLIIIDSAMWFGKKLNGHFNPQQAIKFLKSTIRYSHILKNMRITIVLTQIGHSWPSYKEARGALHEFCKKNKIPFKVLVAYDGLKFKI